MARKKNGGEEGGATGKEWLDTYADTITLLMTFFVLLYSMSSVDASKFQALSSAMTEYLMGKPSPNVIASEGAGGDDILAQYQSSVVENNSDSLQSDSTEIEMLYQKVSQFLIDEEIDTEVDVSDNDNGVVLRLNDNVLFETSSAILNSDSYRVLDKISKLLETLNNDIVIEGHTDNRPINTPDYPSNWELSTARAVNVTKYFIEAKGLNPDRFSASGYGEYRPLVPNETDENMTKNRRVSILILKSEL